MGMKYHIIGEENLTIEKGSVICLGNFDGVHLGHQRLIQTAVKLANEHDLRSLFFTMFPSPKSVLGKREDKYLTDLEDRNQLSQNLGINQMIVLRFTTEVAHYSYTDFI